MIVLLCVSDREIVYIRQLRHSGIRGRKAKRAKGPACSQQKSAISVAEFKDLNRAVCPSAKRRPGRWHENRLTCRCDPNGRIR